MTTRSFSRFAFLGGLLCFAGLNASAQTPTRTPDKPRTLQRASSTPTAPRVLAQADQNSAPPQVLAQAAEPEERVYMNTKIEPTYIDGIKIARINAELEQKVIAWRRDLHQNPELSNREMRTAKVVADHLRTLGLEVKTGIAHTGVVGILKGGLPGPVIGLRADMDALPVVERVNLPFASKVKATYIDKEVGVMHACGHDTHVAMLMGAAEMLAGMRAQLAGTVVFVFQPAEEGAPPGEEGGADLMVAEGVLDNPKVEVMFGIHINSQTPVGVIKYRPGGTMAASDRLKIVIDGTQTHGAYPWKGVDPIVTAAQIILGLQTTVSRMAELTKGAAVVTIGQVDAGVRGNIISEQATMIGTIRTLDTAMQTKLHRDIERVATHIAESQGARATVTIERATPVTYNDPTLTARMLPTLQAVAGADQVQLTDAVTGAEDFAFYGLRVPSLFVFVGGMDPSKKPDEVAPHHTPDFYIDERGLKTGVETYVGLVLGYGQ